jgi:hypothetical protein
MLGAAAGGLWRTNHMEAVGSSASYGSYAAPVVEGILWAMVSAVSP